MPSAAPAPYPEGSALELPVHPFLTYARRRSPRRPLRTFPERFGEATIRRRDCQPWAEEIHHAICEAYQPEEI
jgi:hypothetical protein